MERLAITAAVALSALAWTATPSGVRAQTDLELHVSTWARAFRPGEVLLIHARPSLPVAQVDGSVFGRATSFRLKDDSGVWVALAGIPLDTRTGTYNLRVEARDAGGARKVARVPVQVRPHGFQTRELRVDKRFVEPPPSAGPRIAEDARRLAAVFVETRQARLWSGPFQPPVPGRASSSFGRLSTFNGKPRGRHQGTDLAAAEGTPVEAPNDGEIVLVADLYFSGNTIVIDHGEGLYSLVAHLSRTAVETGTRVARGDRLGYAGATGRVTGPHVHWAVRLRDVSVDPLSLIAAVKSMNDEPSAPVSTSR